MKAAASRVLNGLGAVNNALLLPLLVVLAVEVGEQSGEQYATLNYVMCVTFGTEWALGLWLADDRKAYLRSPTKIADLVSSIPFSLVFSGVRVLRLARLLRFVRVLMQMRGASDALRNVARAGCWVASIVLSSAIIIQSVEPGRMTFEQSVWWAIVTMSTVGYGDIAPITPAGHAVATSLDRGPAMTRERTQQEHLARHVARRARRDQRWHEQAAKLISRACWPDYSDDRIADRAKRIMGCSVDGQAPMHFDVALVRTYCERLLADADALDQQREVFADWTRDRGKGPDRRRTRWCVNPNDPGAPAVGDIVEGQWSWANEPHKLRVSIGTLQYASERSVPWVVERKYRIRDGVDRTWRLACTRVRARTGVDGWPGNLAREFVAEQRKHQACSYSEPGGVACIDGILMTDSLTSEGKWALFDAVGRGLRCPKCEMFNPSRAFVNGGNLRRAAQRLLDTLDGRHAARQDITARRVRHRTPPRFARRVAGDLGDGAVRYCQR